MKPVVYFDFEDIGNDQVSIDKKRLKEILDEVYQAGYEDGKNFNTLRWTPPVPSNPVIPNEIWGNTKGSATTSEKQYGSSVTCNDVMKSVRL
jgi:hypothetical protein